MTYGATLHFIHQYGYAALFFSTLLGVFGSPIPDEVLVMTGGLFTAFGLLEPIPAFFLTYLGVISGISLCYLLGRQLGSVVFHYLLQNQRSAEGLTKAKRILDRFGHYACLNVIACHLFVILSPLLLASIKCRIISMLYIHIPVVYCGPWSILAPAGFAGITSI